jgi:hypothetical protein
VDGRSCLDLESSTGGNESRVALLPGGFRDGAALLCYASGFRACVGREAWLFWQIHGTLQVRWPSAFAELPRDK